MKVLLLLPLLLGCRHVERVAGGSFGGFAATDVSRDLSVNGRSVAGGQGSVFVGFSVEEPLSINTWPWHMAIALDLLAGPTAVWAASEFGGGPQLSLRPRFVFGPVEPFLVVSGAWTHFTGRWRNQATPWGWLLSAGVGTRIRLNSTEWLSISIRHLHESNGSLVFDQPQWRPNPGFDASAVFIGWESRW